MEKSSFAARHRLDSGFWLVFVATSWLAVAMGFWAPVAERYAGKAPYVAPLILVIHVFVYFAWLVLLSLQVLLINRGRTELARVLSALEKTTNVFLNEAPGLGGMSR